MKGKLFVFEGIDGCGAETQAKNLLRHLKQNNIPSQLFDYPDYPSPVGRLIKEYLYSDNEFSLNLQFLLHAADMIKDTPRIKQFLENGEMVVCNRYYTSILGYQCGQGFPLEKALKIAEMFGVPQPDKILYLRISPETALQRKKKEKDGNLDRNEKKLEFQRRIASQYERLVNDSIFGPWYVIDGERSIDEVFGQVRKILQV